MKILINSLPAIFLLSSLSLSGFCQSSIDSIYLDTDVEIQPTYAGGINSFYSFIAKTMRYPTVAFKNGVEGRVLVEFVIDKTGSVVEESIIVKEGAHKSLNKEAIRVFKLSPVWSPGLLTANGPAVSTKMIVPITFTLARVPESN